MKSLIVRTLSGLVYVGVIITCILLGETALTWMAAAFCGIAIVEFEKITHEMSPKTVPTLFLDVLAGVCLVFGWKFYPLIVWVFIMLCRMTLQLYIKSDTPLSDMSKSMMGQIYIALPLGIMAAIGQWWNTLLVLAVFTMIWINDTGAFIVGSTLGKHRLFKRISPKKSWEGFFGGLVFNIVAGAVFSTWCSTFFGLNGIWRWIGLGVVVTVFATWGDLVESMIKRTLHIKDSGNIIPGHGGILDRIDSLLFVMPATLLYLIFLALI